MFGKVVVEEAQINSPRDEYTGESIANRNNSMNIRENEKTI
jgi:hypothetical protein